MSDRIKRRKEYKDFRFRRRHDHFLRFKLSGATPEEVAITAKELGFNLNVKYLARKRAKKISSNRIKSFLVFLRNLFKQPKFLLSLERVGIRRTLNRQPTFTNALRSSATAVHQSRIRNTLKTDFYMPTMSHSEPQPTTNKLPADEEKLTVQFN